MSALGQKQTFRSAVLMSALSLKADMFGANWDVRYGQKRTLAGLLNHLVGER
jgi:hypothetical protein